MAAGNGFLPASPDARYGDSNGTFALNEMWAQIFQCPGTGTQNITEIGLYTYTGFASQYLKFAIFEDDSANGCPGAMVSNSESSALEMPLSPMQKFSFTYTTIPQLTGGSYYWLGCMQSGTQYPSRFDTGTGPVYVSGMTYGTWPTDAQWHSHTNLSRDYSIYAVYESASTNLNVSGASLSHAATSPTLATSAATLTMSSASFPLTADSPTLGAGLWSEDFSGIAQQILYKFEVYTEAAETVDVEGSELFTNADLESWNSATDPVWWSDYIAGSSTVNRESTSPHGGTYCVRLDTDSDSNAACIGHTVSLTEGQEYRISFWYRNSDVTKPCYLVADYDQGGGVYKYLQADGNWENTWDDGFEYYIHPDGSTEWAEFSTDFVSPVTGNVYFEFGALPGYRASSSCYFDDLSLKTLTPTLTAGWVDLTSIASTNYLREVSFSLGGAGVSPEPIAAQWSATIANDDGMFHPNHPTSNYGSLNGTQKPLFTVGRKVRISVGRMQNGMAYFWQRLIGYMDAPKFSHGSRTVSLSGCDYTKNLTDTALGHPGNYFGTLVKLDSVDSTGVTGPELYDLTDAFAVTAGEANSIAGGWSASNLTITSASDAGGGSSYVARLVRGAATGAAYVHNADIGTVASDTWYIVSFKAKYVAGTEYATAQFYQTVGSTLTSVSDRIVLTDAGYETISVLVKAIKAGALEARFAFSQKFSVEDDEFRVDALSVKEYEPEWFRYPLPDGCNGPYYVTLDGVPCYSGNDDATNWHYDEAKNALYFDKNRQVADGTENLWVYYYTDQTPEGVVASLLATAGLYADAATALAAIDYTATGITLHRVWFEAGDTALEAIQKVCERCDYRFWFAADGTPCFKPAPEVSEPEFIFQDFGDLVDVMDFQDLAEIKNRVSIEGAEQDIFNVTAERVSSRLKGEASDPTSIAAYLEKTCAIENHLFEDQGSIDDMCASILAGAKDPKLYAELTLFANAVPLEVGQTIQWRILFSGASPTGGALFMGIIRDISIEGPTIKYKCEITTQAPTTADTTLGVRNAAFAVATSGTSIAQLDADTILAVQAAEVAHAASSPAVGAGADTQMYLEADAMAKTGEANAINPHWAEYGATISSTADAGGGSTYVGLIYHPGISGDCYVHSAHIADLTSGTSYAFSVKYNYAIGDAYGYMRLYQMVGSTLTLVGTAQTLTQDTWTILSFTFTALATAPLQMRVGFASKDSVEGDQVRIDEISVKAS